MGIGELGNFSAYGFAPASLVAPLGSSGVVMNAIIAVIYLKEKIRLRDVIGIVWAILGGYLIVAFSSYTDALLTAKQIVFYLKQYPFIIYIVIEANGLILIQYMQRAKHYSNVVTMLLQVAILGSFTVIASKGLSSMLRLTFDGRNQLDHPVFYFLGMVLVLSIIAQIKYLNEAMANYDATIVMPVNFILFSVSAIVGGIVFYREYYNLSFMQVALCLFGAVLSFLGVYLICGGRKALEVDERTNLLDDESPIGTTPEADIQLKDMVEVDPEIPLKNMLEVEPESH